MRQIFRNSLLKTKCVEDGTDNKKFSRNIAQRVVSQIQSGLAGLLAVKQPDDKQGMCMIQANSVTFFEERPTL